VLSQINIRILLRNLIKCTMILKIFKTMFFSLIQIYLKKIKH